MFLIIFYFTRNTRSTVQSSFGATHEQLVRLSPPPPVINNNSTVNYFLVVLHKGDF